MRLVVAETLGTAMLTAATFGSALMASQLTADTGLALLANSLATGAALWVLITILGPVSGAHMNPAVTLVFALSREISARRALGYILAQVLGAVLGAALAHAMFGQDLWQVARTPRSGAPLWLAEVVATFGLVLTILGARRATGAPVAAMVAAYITSAYWFTASTSFANPAVTLARTLTASPAAIRAADAPAYVAAQLLGAVLALALGAWLFRAPDRAG